MRISDAAMQSGLSIDTIRYYEKSGLVPRISRGPDGRRQFSPENIDWLVLLNSLRETGMPMKTMRRFAVLYRDGNSTIPERKRILQSHQETLKTRRDALNRCAEILTYKLSMYDTIMEKPV